MRNLSGKESCILSLLLERGELFGLELVDKSEGELKRGTVYVTLSRMEEKGLVVGRVETDAAPHPGLPRRLFRATALGARMVEAQRAFEMIAKPGAVRA